MLIPRSLRLTDPGLVQRWEVLAVHAREVPRRPHFVAYRDTRGGNGTLSAIRKRLGSALVQFYRTSAECEEAMNALAPGSKDLQTLTEYRVSVRAPFIIRDHRPVLATVIEPGRFEAEPLDEGGLLDTLQRLHAPAKLFPSAEELDSLLDFLAHAEARTLVIG